MPSWRSFGVYKLDINQGNYLSQDMVDKLKVGMTPAQVKHAARHAARQLAVPRRPLGLRLRILAPGAGRRASQLHRLLRRRQARALGRRRDAAIRRRAQPLRERQGAADSAARAKRALGSLSRRVSAVMSPDGRSPMTVRVAIAGAGGRMGQALIEATLGRRRPRRSPARSTSRAVRRSAPMRARISVARPAFASRGRRRRRARLRRADRFHAPAGTLAHLAACAQRRHRGRRRHDRLRRRRQGGDRRACAQRFRSCSRRT